jgi:hypothetical protein
VNRLVANTKVWYAKEATVKIGSGTVISGATAVWNMFGSGTTITGVLKDISITEPVGDVDKIDILGTDTAGFQNAEVEEKPAGMVEMSGTMILPGDEVTELMMYGGGSAVVGGYTRYRPGLATRTKFSLLVDLNDSTDRVSIGMAYAWLSQKDIKVTGADGHFESSFTAKCLPRDYAIDFKD